MLSACCTEGEITRLTAGTQRWTVIYMAVIRQGNTDNKSDSINHASIATALKIGTFQ